MGGRQRAGSGIVGLVIGAVVVTVLGWIGARRRMEQALLAEDARLAAGGDGAQPFDPSMLDGLPAPARRYLTRAIAPGTPLASSVRLAVGGRIRLGPGDGWRRVVSRELLAPGRGFIWRAAVHGRFGPISGYDLYGRGRGEMRWWWLGVVPLMRGVGPDVSRAAAGRLAAELVWMPAALLPQRGCRWTEVDEHTAEAALDVDGLEVSLRLTVDDDGRLVKLRTNRWRPDAQGGHLASFGCDTVTEERTFGGYTIPSRMRVGWDLDTRHAFAFFQPVVDTAVFR